MSGEQPDPARADLERLDVRFRSGDADCAAWLYRPRDLGTQPRPAVVLAHGLGAVKEMRLDAYAERFCGAGYVALVFDYRHFGESGGEPRQLLDIKRQLEDWRAAVGFTRSLPEVDGERVAVFGSSFGGGHAIVTAADDQRIAAAIAQCPFTSGTASLRTLSPATVLRLMRLALADELSRLRGTAPVRVATVGPPGAVALMNAPDAEPGYQALQPPGGSRFENGVAARFVNHVTWYHPGRHARRVRCPILFSVCDDDSVAPARATLRHAQRAPRGKIARYPIGHFDVYVGDHFERAVGDQLRFLRESLPT